LSSVARHRHGLSWPTPGGQDGAEDHRDDTGTSPREQRALKKS
jgi:hypothetical protein